MRVWIVNQYALPPSASGSTRHYALGRELVASGHEVWIMASNFSYLQRRRLQNCTGIQHFDGVSFLWLPTPVYRTNSIDRLWNNLVFTKQLLCSSEIGSLPKPDVIIGSSPHPFGAWAALHLAQRYGSSFVTEIRDLWPQSLIDIGHISPHHPFVLMLSILEQQIYRRAERIISLLNRAVDYIAARGVPREKIVYIPNGVDLKMVPAIFPPPTTSTFSILYAGSHGLGDGLDVLLDTAKIIHTNRKNIEFTFIGDGSEKQRLTTRAREMNLTNIRFMDPVPKNQIYNRLQNADALVLLVEDSPIYKWGFSFNKFYDYLAVGRPILFVGNIVDNPISSVQAGIVVPPNNPPALASAISTLAMQSVEERWEMGLRGRHYVEKFHDISELAKKLNQVLLDITQPTLK